MEHEYAFDVKLIAAIRIKAEDEATARKLLREYLDAAESNFGHDRDGNPLLGEASLDVDDASGPHLYEVDGEEV